jgi:hypothetical protein
VTASENQARISKDVQALASCAFVAPGGRWRVCMIASRLKGQKHITPEAPFFDFSRGWVEAS